MNFHYRKTNFHHQFRGSDGKSSTAVASSFWNQNLLVRQFFVLLIILQSVTVTRMENNNNNNNNHHHNHKNNNQNLIKTNGGSDSGNNNNNNNQTINIQCPDFHESSACPCYKFDDGKCYTFWQPNIYAYL
jgi:hypothetical protein